MRIGRAWLGGLGLAVGIILAAGGSAGADPLKPSCSSVTGGTNEFLDEIGSYRDRVRTAEKRRAYYLTHKYPNIIRNGPDAPGYFFNKGGRWVSWLA